MSTTIKKSKQKAQIMADRQAIAEFLGWGFIINAENDTVHAFFNGKPKWKDDVMTLSEILSSPTGHAYDSDWNKLIRAIIKFRDLDLDDHIYTSHVQEIDDNVTDAYDISQAFQTVVAAVKWYKSYVQTESVNN